MVGVGPDHHGEPRCLLPDRDRLRDRHRSLPERRYLHVEHAVRVLDSVQAEAAARARVQQYEEDTLSGRTVYGKAAEEQQMEAESFYDRYKKKMGVKNDQGNYVATEDQERYDREMEEYSAARAEFDRRKSERLATK